MTPKEFKELRISNNLTQAETAKIMNIKRESVSYFENGKRTISVNAIDKFLFFLGLKRKSKQQINIQCSYNKKDKKNFEQAIWLNRFVMNLSEIKRLNKEK